MRACYGLLQLLLLLWCLNPPLGHADRIASPQQLLQQMVEASRLSDYELLFLRPHKAGIESWLYRHAVINQQSVARLLALEGHPTEVWWQGNNVSYSRHSKDPLSVPDDTSYEVLPRVMQADIKRLCAHYDFSLPSTARIANRDCQVIRLIPQDSHRYGYMVWLDRQSKLLLRADLLAPGGQQVEQFRVVALSQGASIPQALRRAMITPRTVLPILLPPQQSAITTWQPGWLPPGFERQFSGQRSLPSLVEPVDAELYSDGLLTVALYVHAILSEMPPKPLALQEQHCSIYSEVRSGREITVVGEIPLSSARRMAQQVMVNIP
jgi:sigma-E factor negative regulatory protein RseB